MSYIELTNSPLTLAGRYDLKEDASKYRTISTTSNLAAVSTASVTEAYIALYPPSGNIYCSSTRTTYNKNSVIDASFASTWVGARTNMFTDYIGILLQGLDLTEVTHIAARSSINNSRRNRKIQVRAVRTDNTYDVLGDFITEVNGVYRCKLPKDKIGEYTGIIFQDMGRHDTGNTYYGLADICLEKEVRTNVHTLTFSSGSTVTAYGTHAIVSGDVSSCTLMANPLDIFDPTPRTYRTYKRDADGIPQLVLADITSIASGMNKTTLNDDLQSLVTMAKVDDIIAKMNTCTFAGRVDTEADLPEGLVRPMPYAAPELRDGNGVPFEDEYAVSASSYMFKDDGTTGEPYKPYHATYDTDGYNPVWHTDGITNPPHILYMTFKNPMIATNLYFKNRDLVPSGDYVYPCNDISIEAKDTSGTWVELYRGINSNVAGHVSEIDIDNSTYYQEYRLYVRSSHGGLGNSVAITVDVCRLSGLSNQVDPDSPVKAGTIYLVGPEGEAHEEFIYTDTGNWERLGSVRASDVDLSDYTTTDGMNSTIGNATTTLEGNLTDMNTTVSDALDDMIVSVESALTATDTKVDESMAGITKELKIVDSAPTTWTDDMDDTGIILCVD